MAWLSQIWGLRSPRSRQKVSAAGEALLAPVIPRRLIEQFVRSAPAATPPGFEELTPREVEVLALIARGLANGEIAAELVLSEETVKTHVKRLFRKLGVRDRVQAVVLAHEAGEVVGAVRPRAGRMRCGLA